jgi:N-acetylglucosamine-6-phosphate deacetylase
MDLGFIHCSVILEHEILRDGAVLVQNGVITWVGPTSGLPIQPKKTKDLGGFFISPGYVDLHVHGGGGIDSTVAEPERIKVICRTHESFGTTSLCLALVSSPVEVTTKALGAISHLATIGTGGARLLGAYLEGPFINPARCGAHSTNNILEPDLELMSSFTHAAGGWLRIVSLAPELPGSDSLIDWLVKAGFIVAIGHTSATCEQTLEAIKQGCSLATHLFNGMKPFHHRDPNAAGAVLASADITAELLLDETHLHPTAARLAFNALGTDRVVLVTDATSVVGSPDGRGYLGQKPIVFDNGAAYLESGLLAGSALTMADAVKNAIDLCKLDIPTAVRCASLNPASVLGLADRLGSISAGKYADLLVLDPSDLRVLESYVNGERIFRSPY